jgi:D-glycero-D-manno-heptose 1,7-bisphosphate phosphatase
MKRKAPRKPAVFLDRDGTLIHDAGFLSRPSQVKLFPGSAEALRLLRGAGYRLFVVSNQSGVARGYFPEGSVKKANRRTASLLKAKGARVDRFFYCPHYPKGKVKSLAIVCDCRKPNPGMVKKAARLYPLDLKRSYVVGDKIDDLILAKKARVAAGILVRTGKGRKSEKELRSKGLRNMVAANLLSAAKWIIKDKG